MQQGISSPRTYPGAPSLPSRRISYFRTSFPSCPIVGTTGRPLETTTSTKHRQFRLDWAAGPRRQESRLPGSATVGGVTEPPAAPLERLRQNTLVEPIQRPSMVRSVAAGLPILIPTKQFLEGARGSFTDGMDFRTSSASTPTRVFGEDRLRQTWACSTGSMR